MNKFDDLEREYNEIKGNAASTGIVIGMIALCIGLTFLVPLILFGFGWLTGWIIQVTIGETVISGLNMVFNTDRFTPEMLPMFCATISLIGGFFKGNNIDTDKMKK